YVPGPGQYKAAAHKFDPALDNICDPDLMVVGAIRFPRRTHLVLVHCHDHDAGAAEPLVAAPRVPETAGFTPRDQSGMRSGWAVTTDHFSSLPRTQRSTSAARRHPILLCMGLFSRFCVRACGV